jgi:hypothetical protein
MAEPEPWPIRAGYTGDLAIIPEPTRLEVVVAHAGAITFTLDVPGRAAHASTRREGVSALDKVMVMLDALADDEHSRNEAEPNPMMQTLGLPYPTIVGKVNGGEWASTVLDRVVMRAGMGSSSARHRMGRPWNCNGLSSRPGSRTSSCAASHSDWRSPVAGSARRKLHPIIPYLLAWPTLLAVSPGVAHRR